jgi:hypothetical protein
MSKKIPRTLMSIDINLILYEIKGYKKGKKGQKLKEKRANEPKPIIKPECFDFLFPLLPHFHLLALTDQL